MSDRAKGIPIAKEGVPFVMGAAAPAVLAGLLGCKKVSIALGAVACFTGWFFRNPPRTIPRGDDLILASGDGQVIAVQEEFEPRYLKDQNPRTAPADVTFRTNVQGTWSVLQAAEDAGVKRVVVASSDALQPEKPVKCEIIHQDGTKNDITLLHSYNNFQIKWLRAGSALNVLRSKEI